MGVRRGARLRRSVWWLGAMMTVVVATVLPAGWLVYGRSSEDPLTRVDAIVVLGGEHDGREEYGLDLARAGYAGTVVLSDPYGSGDPLMDRLCAGDAGGIRVLCETPEPNTTRGEAIFTQRLAKQYGWHSVIVVSWGYHLVRARYVFGHCFDGGTVMRAVPRQYRFNLADWALTYSYQAVGMLKAVIQGDCRA